jgi:hypothetical protein
VNSAIGSVTFQRAVGAFSQQSLGRASSRPSTVSGAMSIQLPSRMASVADAGAPPQQLL